MAKIRKILGTMAFGDAMSEAQSHEMLKNWSKLGYTEIDTALMYQNGKAEKIIGKLKLCQDPKKVEIATKAYPKKGFKAQDIVNQLNESLASMNVNCVNIFYLHWPDYETPIEETLKGVDQLYKEGKFKEFGLSNYASWQTADIYHICKQNGYVLPTVYQGMYNALTRDIEQELIPALQKFGIRFYVYNPLAGGMLSGKYNFSDDDNHQPKGRFFSSDEPNAANARNAAYRDRYWRSNYKMGIDQIQKVLKSTYQNKVPLYEAAMRWLIHHSQLKDNDGIILGVSKNDHLEANNDATNNGDTLHEDVVKALDDAWELIKSDCPKYNR